MVNILEALSVLWLGEPLMVQLRSNLQRQSRKIWDSNYKTKQKTPHKKPNILFQLKHSDAFFNLLLNGL